MMEFRNPVPVIVENNKEGYALYVRDGGTLENDVWCVVLCSGGAVRHYRSDQIHIYANSTFGIDKQAGTEKKDLHSNEE
jgi:hypothetical protein